MPGFISLLVSKMVRIVNVINTLVYVFKTFFLTVCTTSMLFIIFLLSVSLLLD